MHFSMEKKKYVSSKTFIYTLWLSFFLCCATLSFAGENTLITGVDIITVSTSCRPSLCFEEFRTSTWGNSTITIPNRSVWAKGVLYNFKDSSTQRKWELILGVHYSTQTVKYYFQKGYSIIQLGPNKKIDSLGNESLGWDWGSNRIHFYRDNCYFELSSEEPFETLLQFAYKIDSCLQQGICGVERGDKIEIPFLQIPNLPKTVYLGQRIERNIYEQNITTANIIIGIHHRFLFRLIGDRYISYSYYPQKQKGIDTISIPIASPKNVISSVNLTFNIQ